MNSLKYLLLTLTLTSILSCGSSDEQNNLSISFGGATAFFIDAGQVSCYKKLYGTDIAPDIQPFSFSLSNPTISWSDTTHYLVVSYIKLTLKHAKLPGGLYSQTVAAQEMGAQFYSGSSDWNGVIDPASVSAGVTIPSTKATSTQCPYMRFGGISIPEKDRSFVASGTVEIVGYMTTSLTNGEMTPIRGKTSISVEYRP